MSRRQERSARRTGREADAVAIDDEPDDAAEFAAWGERFRRAALGAAAALFVSRAYWPGEPDYRVDAGTGLIWVLALMVVAGIGLAAALTSGAFRFRWSWADVALVATIALIGASSSHAIDRRPFVLLGAVSLTLVLALMGVAMLVVALAT